MKVVWWSKGILVAVITFGETEEKAGVNEGRLACIMLG